MTFRSEAHQAIADRERTLVSAHAHRGDEHVFAAIAQDRAERWTDLLKDREETGEIREWAAQMSIVHKQQMVRIHRNTLPWITALYVARYGEAEDFWPAALTAEDAIRARGWLQGNVPDGVTYLLREA